MSLRWIRFGAWTLAALLAAAWVVARVAGLAPTAAASPPGPDGLTPLGGVRAPAFTLTDQSGRPLSLAALRGRVVVLAFVDSAGTTEAPIEARTLRYMLERLGPRAASQVAVVAVNVDLRHASPADLRAFTRSEGLAGRWQFVTGTPRRLRAVWRSYHEQVSVLRGQLLADPNVFVVSRTGEERWVTTLGSDASASAVASQGTALARAVEPLLAHPGRLVPARAPGVPAAVGTAFTLPAVDGKSVTVARGRPVLLDFFATWCQACKEDMAVLRRYALRRRKDPALPPLVAVDLRLAEPGTAYVRQFVAEEHLNFPVAMDVRGAVSDAYGVSALPTLVLVGANGKVAFTHLGLVSLSWLLAHVRAGR
jgi:cytochrome oxidase Cu insertion factor (SCO1/SenC/PrrC family)